MKYSATGISGGPMIRKIREAMELKCFEDIV